MLYNLDRASFLGIKHFNLVNCAVSRYCKGNIRSKSVILGSFCFVQSVGFAGDKLCNYSMDCAICNPFLNYIAVFVNDLELCTDYISVASVVTCIGIFVDFNMCRRIIHCNNDLAFVCLGNIKINVTCEIVAVSRNYLMHCVALSCDESGVVDDMRLICRYPFVDYISVCINYLNLCAGKLIFAGQSLFRQLHDNRCILHIYYIDLTIQRNAKAYLTREIVTSGRIIFDQLIL